MNFKYLIIIILFSQSLIFCAQQTNDSTQVSETFWKNVHFGGGIQLGISNAYTTFGISPSSIYEFSDKFSAGIGVSYLYSKYKYDDIQYHIFGTSALALYNPIKKIQLSTEFEELRVNSNTYDSYWVPAWYMGLGYSMSRHATIGMRYDVLYNDGKSIYDSPFTPFIKIYF